jgi:alkenylglycerophosphocholine hydrolase
MAAFLFSLGLVSVCLFMFGINLDLMWLRLLAKPLPILAMIAWVCTQTKSSYRNRVIIGLVLCVIADMLLEFRKSTFLYGVIFFLLGHIAYIAGFIKKNAKLKLELLLPFSIWGGVIFFVLKDGLGKMYYPILAYTLVIVIMMWRAAALADTGKNTNWTSYLIVVGAVSFAFGDTLIAFDRYYEKIPSVRYSISTSYYIAQFLIASSVALYSRTMQKNGLQAKV